MAHRYDTHSAGYRFELVTLGEGRGRLKSIGFSTGVWINDGESFAMKVLLFARTGTASAVGEGTWLVTHGSSSVRVGGLATGFKSSNLFNQMSVDVVGNDVSITVNSLRNEQISYNAQVSVVRI